jgi:deoxyribodipyrimidine photo-lyase
VTTRRRAPRPAPLPSSPDETPTLRIKAANAAPVRADGDYVLYWMIAFRRAQANFALQRAVEHALAVGKPLVIFEPLRVDYPWASDRLHRFVIDGMQENARQISAASNRGVYYYPYVEPAPGAGRGLLAALAERACVVVTDDYPAFFLPRMVEAAGKQLAVRLEAVDSNGLLPQGAAERTFTTAFSFRAFLQKNLAAYLEQMPQEEPLKGVELPPLAGLPAEILKRWPPASAKLLAGDAAALAALPIDHSVAVVAPTPGGAAQAWRRANHFIDGQLDEYAVVASHPDEDGRSGLSPYLHFGHISPHSLLRRVAAHESWTAARLGAKTGGKRTGWWNMAPGAEAWLDELVTWRELGFNMASRETNYDQYESLPEWARTTLEQHASDERPHVYDLDELAAARTHDALWNAAQTQLLREGRIHNYLRMLWGKKILEWSPTPRDALAVMIELNNRYALDGRDPNSYSGIFWVLGRYDRAWGPERPIYGKVRYMSSENTRKKLRVAEYLRQYQPG